MRTGIVILCMCVINPPALRAADSAVDYTRDIKPIFKQRCFSCHGALKQESGLRLDTGKLIRKGAEDGAVIIAAKRDQSPLVDRITASDESLRMPPEGEPLSPAQIKLIREWIAAGAQSPEDEQPEPDPREHWSFRKPVRPIAPALKATDWVRNPIDAFIGAQHEQRGLTPLPPATREILLRRAYLDLIGVPPTRDELHAFLKDDSPDAYEQVVDRLLNSEHYGERWGRHWMDVWRYSDWYGRRQVNDVRNSYPHIWRWRDWIIRSLNSDKGYDQMVREMLAADELHPDDDTRIPALGFIVRNWFSLNYDTWKQDLVEHTGKAFLGLRLNCAHCHDHKYDPISQQEYFQFRAFFEPLEVRHDRVPGGPALTKYIRYRPGSGGSLKPIEAGLPRVYDHFFDDKTFMYRLGDTRDRFDRPPVDPAAPAILGGDSLQVEPLKLPAVAWYPGLKPWVQQAEVKQRETAMETARKSVATSQAQLPVLQKQLIVAEKELAEAEQLAEKDADSEANSSAARERLNTIAFWRFEGADDETGFLSDSSGNGHTLHRVTGVDPPASPVALADTGSVRAFAINSHQENTKSPRTNKHAAGFQQKQSYAYLAADGDSSFFSNTFSLECLVHFDVSEENFNRTIADYEGCWTLLHRGIDEKTFELRLRYTNADGELRDIATGRQTHPESSPLPDTTSPALILHTAHDYHIGLVMGEQTVTLWTADLTVKTPLASFAFPRSTTDQDFSRLNRPDAKAPFNIGNSDGTGRVVGLIDEVRYSSVALSTVQIAAVTGQSTNDVVRKAAARLASLQQEYELAETSLAAAKAELESTTVALQAVKARIAADKVRFGKANEPVPADEVARQAARQERLARLAAARAKLAQAKRTLLESRTAATTDAKRIKQAEAGSTAAAKALAELEKQTGDPGTEYTAFGPKYPDKSSGRRRALANWIGNRDNPLTARVAVNHIWMRHFGRPLVESVFDFGRAGKQPTHPQLLDWLAVELMEPSTKTGSNQKTGGWSMKHLHRLIVTSATYRLSSRPGRVAHPNASIDSDNALWWKFDRRRLEAETVRDGLLHVSGQLDKTLGGHEIDPKLQATNHRRSLYFTVYPEAGGMMRFMTMFDAPNPCDCYRRTESIVPQQALALSNSTLALDAANRIEGLLSKADVDNKETANKETANKETANKATTDTQTDNRFITAGFEQVLSRSPTADEISACHDFLMQQRALYDSSTVPSAVSRSRASLLRVLLNHNDFVTIH